MTAERISPDHAALQSIRRDGFLSEARERSVPALRSIHKGWFGLALRSNRVAGVRDPAEASPP